MPSIGLAGPRLGLIGYGRMGRLHATHIHEATTASLVAFCDTDSSARHSASAQYRLPAYDSIDDFLTVTMDGVIIASSTRAHAAHVQKAAEAGLAVFTEKPVGLSMAEADAALAAVVASGAPFQIGYQRRWDPDYLEMKRRIDAGDIGEPLFFKTHGRDPHASVPTNWGLRVNGGLFSNCAIHDYDAARFLLGREVSEVTASGAVLVHHGLAAVDDLDACSTTLYLGGGQLALTEWTRFASYGFDVTAEVIGTEGVVRLGSAQVAGVSVQGRNPTAATVTDRFRTAYRASMKAFVKSIEEWTEPALTVRDARAALQIALAARESYERGSVRLQVPPLLDLGVTVGR